MKTIFIFLSLTCVDDPGGKSVWHVGAEAEIRMEKCQEKSDWSVINQTLHEAPKLFLVNPVQAREEGDTLGPAVPPSQQSRHNTEQWWPARGHNTETELSHWISHRAMRYKPLICCCDGGQVSLRNSPLAHTVLSLQPWGQPRLLRSLKDNIYSVSVHYGPVQGRRSLAGTLTL